MKKKWIVVLAGIFLFGIGYALLTFSPDPMEENLEVARQAENPKEAATAIATNNSKNAVSNTNAYLFVDGGMAMTVAGIFMSEKGERML